MIMAADLAIKEPCRVATTANIASLSTLLTVDGVTVSAGDRVLVRAQSTATQNGIYVAASGAWSRATDFDGAGEVAGGTQAFVTSGTRFADSRWRVAGNGAITIGSSAIDFDPEFIQAGAGAAPRTLQAKARERISVLDYGAVGDGTTNDSAAIQAAVDANKGETIVLPSGYTFLAAGISLVGSTYDDTAIIVEGRFLLGASGGNQNWGVPSSRAWVGIVLQDVENIFVDVPGMMDGNRANQADDQQIHLLILAGARHTRIAHFNGCEVRGDGILITSETNIDPLTINSSDIVIGQIRVINSADDGRNALSVGSCENLLIGGGLSVKVGGRDVGNLVMPGGFDIEPDGNWHLVKNVRSGPWIVETKGTSGIGVIGLPITDDETRDWNVQDVAIAPSTVFVTSEAVGGPILKRCRRVTADLTLVRSTPDAGIAIDYADFCSVRARAQGCTSAVVVGYEDSVRDSNIHVEVEDYTVFGLGIVGADRCRFSGYLRGSGGAGFQYGFMLAVAEREFVTQTDNVYSVDVRYDSDNVFGFHTSEGLTLTNCVVADCAFFGYPDYSAQFGFGTYLPTRNVQGRNFATALPTTGYWAEGDFVRNVDPAIASGKVLLGWSRLTSGGSHSAGTDWTPVYATTS
jgi:hypothetical protein